MVRNNIVSFVVIFSVRVPDIELELPKSAAKVVDISADADHHQGIEERLLRAIIMLS